MSGNMRHSALTFRLACWGLGLIAFAQVLIGGVAVAVRVEKAREVREVIKEVEVPKFVTLPAAQPALVAVAPRTPAPLPPPPEPAPLP